MKEVNKLAKIKSKVNKAVRKGKKMLMKKGSVIQEYMQKQKKMAKSTLKKALRSAAKKL